MSHSQALMVVGSPHEEHQTIMDAKVNDLWTTSMHSVYGLTFPTKVFCAYAGARWGWFIGVHSGNQ